ncbi:MAG TPA: ribbon-helix-helix protein, CopG family [Spirochaetia bacterium]|nr:ribbon-helix-helix protein, CopG family [Spirochaetia bacterium]
MSEHMQDPEAAARVRQSIAEGEQAMASGEPMVTLYRRLSVNVAFDVAAAIEELAARHEVSITEVIRRAVSAYKYVDDTRAAGGEFLVKRGGTVNEVIFE